MKKVLKKMSIVVLALTMMILMTIPAYAGQTLHIPKKANATKYSAKTMKDRYYYNPVNYLAEVGDQKVTVKSSNKNVATVKVKYGVIWVTPKKAVKTTITVKAGKKTYKCAYTVYKYVNPITSVKIGKNTFSGKLYNKNAIANVKYSKFANKKTALKINLKKGWKIKYSDYVQKNWLHSELFKNGSKVKVAGGSGFAVSAYVQNTKTKQTEIIVLYFK